MMPVAVLGLRWPVLLVTALLLALPVSCAPVGNNLGGDPCLLQQYRSSGFSTIGGIQGRLTTLTTRVDALAPQQGTISPSQDISETLTALAEFQYQLGVQQNLLRTGAQPPEGAAFRADAFAAIQKLDIGTQMLAQAYVDAKNDDTLAAEAIVDRAREWMRQGRRLLGQASVDIAALHAFSPNC